MDATLTRRPAGARSRSGSSARVTAIVPTTFVFNVGAVWPANGVGSAALNAIAALLTRTSQRPTSASSLAAKAAIDASSLMSSAMNRAFASPSAATAASPRAASRQARMTSVQLAKSCCATWNPTPLFAPVTTATRGCIDIVLGFLCSGKNKLSSTCIY